MGKYFPEPYERFDGNIRVSLDLSNYVTKADFKGAASINASTLASKADLDSLKTKVDTLDVDKLNTSLVRLSKLSNLVGNCVVKLREYDKLVAKVNAIGINLPNTSLLIIKTQYDSDKQGLKEKTVDVDRKICNTSELVKKTVYNIEIIDIKNQIPGITNLVIKVTLNAKTIKIENKIPSTSTLVRNTNYNIRITKIENKILDISSFGKKRHINNEVTSNITIKMLTKGKLSNQITFYKKLINDVNLD